MAIVCEGCDRPFEPDRADQKVHNAACRQKAYRKRKAAENTPPPKPARPVAGAYSVEQRHEPFSGDGGNKLALLHGLSSPDVVQARVAVVRDEYLSAYPHLSEKDSVRLEQFFLDKALMDLLVPFIFGVASGERQTHARKDAPRTGWEAVPDKLLRMYTSLSQSLGKHANELGLDPSGFAKFAKDATFAQAMRGERVRGLSSAGMDILRDRGVIDAETVESDE